MVKWGGRWADIIRFSPSTGLPGQAVSSTRSWPGVPSRQWGGKVEISGVAVSLKKKKARNGMPRSRANRGSRARVGLMGVDPDVVRPGRVPVLVGDDDLIGRAVGQGQRGRAVGLRVGIAHEVLARGVVDQELGPEPADGRVDRDVGREQAGGPRGDREDL